MKVKEKFLCVSLISLLSFTLSFADATTDFCKVTGSLSLNQKSQNVVFLKNILKEKTLFIGTSTNVYDKPLFNVVKKFQKDNKITQTGGVGPQTLAKMKSLWCVKSNLNTNSADKQFSKIETLDSNVITVEGGSLIKFESEKLCVLKNGGVIDWGDGQFDMIGDKLQIYGGCKKDFYHLYPEDEFFTIKVKNELGLVLYNVEVNKLSSKQQNAFIRNFSSSKLSSESFLFKWDTENSSECLITDNSKYREIVKTTDSKIINSTTGTIFELSCKDGSDRESKAWAVAGNDSDNPKFLIKQFNYIVNNRRIYATWAASENAKNCVIGGDPAPLNGMGIIGSVFSRSYELQCFSGLNSETKSLYVSNNFVSEKPVINYFNYEIKGNDVKMSWDVKNATGCSLLGNMFAAGTGKTVANSGSFLTYFPTGKNAVSITCSSGENSFSVQKKMEFEVK